MIKAGESLLFVMVGIIPMRILVPHRRGETFGVITNILHRKDNKEQYISITQNVWTKRRFVCDRSQWEIKGAIRIAERSKFVGATSQ